MTEIPSKAWLSTARKAQAYTLEKLQQLRDMHERRRDYGTPAFRESAHEVDELERRLWLIEKVIESYLPKNGSGRA